MKGASFRTSTTIGAAGAALIAALTLVVTPIAHADDEWGAIAVSQQAHKWGRSFGQPTEQGAKDQALGLCPGNDCTVLITFTDCGALVQSPTDFHAGSGSRLAYATSAAFEGMPPGSTLATYACNGRGGAVSRT